MQDNLHNPFDPGYVSESDLRALGFRSVGRNVCVARNCTIIGIENIELGDHVRIDGYSCIVASGNGYLRVGSHVHIGGWSYLSAGAGIAIADFANLSQGVRIYTRSDDYSGEHMTNPTVPSEFTGVISGSVTLAKHVIVGSGSVILPGVTIQEGTAVGALSLVNKSLDAWGLFAGCPARRIRDRSRKLLELEARLRSQHSPSADGHRPG